MRKPTAILLVDAGNSSLKWSMLENQKLGEYHSCFYHNDTAIQKFQHLLEKNSDDCDQIIMVSVQGEQFNQKALQLAQAYSLPLRQVKSTQYLAGLNNAYEEPDKLGADRFVAMIAAYNLSNKLQQNKNACIIIDSGTATTIDAVDSQGNHLGGLILPSVSLCTSSLLQNTKQLPLWGKTQKQNRYQPKLFSKNTKDAINSASIFGLCGAIQNICFKMENTIRQGNKNTSIDRFLCGGAAEFLSPYLDFEFQLQNDLIMRGLQVISEYKHDE